MTRCVLREAEKQECADARGLKRERGGDECDETGKVERGRQRAEK